MAVDVQELVFSFDNGNSETSERRMQVEELAALESSTHEKVKNRLDRGPNNVVDVLSKQMQSRKTVVLRQKDKNMMR